MRRRLLAPVLACGLVLLPAACAGNHPKPSIDPAAQERELAFVEWEMHVAVNGHRLALGLTPLRLDERLSAVARAHSRDMADGTAAFGHERFYARVREACGRKCRAVGENVAANNFGRAKTVEGALAGLLASEPHRRNLEGPFERVGIGVAVGARGELFYTQIFAR